MNILKKKELTMPKTICPICKKKKDCYTGTYLITGKHITVCQDCYNNASHVNFTVFK